MKKDSRLKRLHQLQGEIDLLRQTLGINSPGSVLFSSPICAADDETVLVEADGLGGATTCIVTGNYPVDYITKYEKQFASERQAIRHAESWVGFQEDCY